MRIVIIDPSGFTPPYDHCLATALAHQGCRVVLATTRMLMGPWAQDTIYERWEHFYRISSRITQPKIRTYLKGCEHPFDMGRLLRRLRHWKPDVIHFQWIPIPIVDRLFLREFRKMAPLILTVHDTEPFQGTPSSRLQLIGLLPAFRCFDHYIVHTQYSKEMLTRQLSLPEHYVSVIPHGVFAYYRELTSGLGAQKHALEWAKKRKILFFGTIKPYKGVDVLLKAFARLPKSVLKESVLQIVGYPKMPIEPLQSLARCLGIENQVFWDLRYIGEAEVASYFYQADVVALPYRRIDQSGVLAIAFAFEKPVIATRVGGFVETIKDGVYGLLVEPENAESLAQALLRVLDDDELRQRIAIAVKNLATNQLSWESIAKQTVHLYQEILKGRRS
ncbi:MAG: glycosyltransferase [Nitrososphaerota archaeon]